MGLKMLFYLNKRNIFVCPTTKSILIYELGYIFTKVKEQVSAYDRRPSHQFSLLDLEKYDTLNFCSLVAYDLSVIIRKGRK